MKKLLFIAVLALGALTASAQVTDPAERPTADPAQQADPTQQETADPAQRQTIDPSEQQRTVEPAQRPTSNPDWQKTQRATGAQDGYTEIDMKELPGAVKKAVKKNYPKAKLDKVYSNEEGQYKLETSMEDGTSQTMFMDKEGKPIDG